jgi:hypothetical protein
LARKGGSRLTGGLSVTTRGGDAASERSGLAMRSPWQGTPTALGGEVVVVASAGRFGAW